MGRSYIPCRTDHLIPVLKAGWWGELSRGGNPEHTHMTLPSLSFRNIIRQRKRDHVSVVPFLASNGQILYY